MRRLLTPFLAGRVGTCEVLASLLQEAIGSMGSVVLGRKRQEPATYLIQAANFEKSTDFLPLCAESTQRTYSQPGIVAWAN
jgi:hypothetical protein